MSLPLRLPIRLLCRLLTRYLRRTCTLSTRNGTPGETRASRTRTSIEIRRYAGKTGSGPNLEIRDQRNQPEFSCCQSCEESVPTKAACVCYAEPCTGLGIR